ncbi:MAG TPA: DUF2079 domain-containing protein [Chloroflexota bacterium]|nr:DUF2079 domain-containing protein [Chloroflexota bacterium]
MPAVSQSPGVHARPATRSAWRAALVPAAPSIAIGMVWVVVASWSSIAELVTFNSTSRDIGVYLQMLWNTGHGRPFQTTLLESNRIHLAEHVALLLPVLSPLYAMRPDPRWLFVAQTLVLALAAMPVYLLSRRLLGGVILPTAFVAGFFLMPTVTEVAYDAFYPVIWSALPIGFAGYFLLTDRVRPGVALALLAIPIEEEAGLAVFGLGLLLVLRRGHRLLGVALAGFALLWLGLVAMVVMPRFHEPSTLPASGENRTVDHFAALRDHPVETVTDLLTQRVPRAARWLLAPTGGLPLLAPQVLIVDLPQAATLLLADKGERFRHHWTAPMLPTIWLSAVVGYAALRGRPLRVVGVALLAIGSVTTYLLDSNLPGGGDYDPADLAWSDRAEQHAYLVARVPAGASLVASRRALGAVADRAELYVFPPSYQGKLWPPERRAQAYLLDLSNDGTQEQLLRRQSPLRANRPYAIWLAGPDAMLLLERAPEPEQQVDRDLSGIRLRGLWTRQDGETVEVESHWQANTKPATRLTRVVTVLDGDGRVLAESRGTALDAYLPTEQWPAGQEVIERVRLDASPGRQRVVRLRWVDGNGQGDAFEIGIGDSP